MRSACSQGTEEEVRGPHTQKCVQAPREQGKEGDTPTRQRNTLAQIQGKMEGGGLPHSSTHNPRAGREEKGTS